MLRKLNTVASNTGLVLDDHMCGRMGVPITASVVDIDVVLKTDDLGLPLNHLQRETLICMPCNVTWIELISQKSPGAGLGNNLTVQKPRAWIVCYPSQRQPTLTRKHCCVTARSGDSLQSSFIGICATSSTNYPEVVTVKVNWMGSRHVSLSSVSLVCEGFRGFE